MTGPMICAMTDCLSGITASDVGVGVFVLAAVVLAIVAVDSWRSRNK